MLVLRAFNSLGQGVAICVFISTAVFISEFSVANDCPKELVSANYLQGRQEEP